MVSIFKKTFLVFKKDKVLLLTIIFTLPTILIWSSGAISFIWSLIYKFTISRLSASGQLFILLIIPFFASNLALISFLKGKSKLSKRLFFLNVFFVVLVIFFSMVFGT